MKVPVPLILDSVILKVPVPLILILDSDSMIPDSMIP